MSPPAGCPQGTAPQVRRAAHRARGDRAWRRPTAGGLAPCRSRGRCETIDVLHTTGRVVPRRHGIAALPRRLRVRVVVDAPVPGPGEHLTGAGAVDPTARVEALDLVGFHVVEPDPI